MQKSLFLVILSLIFSFQAFTQDTTVDIFIIAGQSNANGRGLVSDLTTQQKTQDASFFYAWHQFLNNATSDSPQYNSGWLAQTVAGETRAGISTQNNGNYSETFGGSDWFGPELGFVARANEINLTTNPIAIIKYAVDGSALTTDHPDYQVSDWDINANDFSDGDCWRGFQAALTAAVASLPENTTPNFKGMIWWQGENGTNAADLNSFIAAVRAHLAANFGLQNSSSFPVIITGNDFWGAGLETGVADQDDYVGFIDSVEYGQIGGFTNAHIGSGENSQSLDVDTNGINDMFDIGIAYADEMALVLAGDVSPGISWTGNAGDGIWSTAGNWSGNTLPADGDIVEINNGDTLDILPNNWDIVNAITFNVSGNSQITNTNAAARLYGGMTFNFASGSGMSGAWIDFQNVTLNFEDGANFTPSSLQLGNTNTLGFTLSESGFTSLTPGILRDSGVVNWSDITFNIDITNYDTLNGNTVELIDFSSHGSAYNDTFNPTINVTAGDSGLTGTLSFNTVSSKIIYTFDGVDPPPATTYDITFINVDGNQTIQTVNEDEVAVPPAGVDTEDKTFTSWPTVATASANATYTALFSLNPATVTWDGDAADGLWNSLSNWSGDALPISGDTIEIDNGDTVDMPGNDWSLPTGITVNVSGNSQIGNTAAAARLYGGMTFNFSSGSGMSGAWIDLGDGILNFENGSTFTPNSIQHRGSTTYGITLASTGFTPLTPGNLYQGVDEDWSNVTFNIDFSNYDVSNGYTIELIDYSSHAAAYDGTFTPTINITAGDSGLTGTLSFDALNSKVIYTFDLPKYILTVTDGTGDGDFTEAANVPILADTITGYTFTNWTSSNGGSFDDINSASTNFNMPANATTVTANYSINRYTVTFALGAGSLDSGDLVQSVDYGASAAEPSVTAPNGYAHTGWDVAFDNIVADITVTALYAELTALTSHSNPYILTSAFQSFSWSDVGALKYIMHFGSALGINDIKTVNAGTHLGIDIFTLPVAGANIFLRLYTVLESGSYYTDYQFTAVTALNLNSSVDLNSGNAVATNAGAFVPSGSNPYVYNLDDNAIDAGLNTLLDFDLTGFNLNNTGDNSQSVEINAANINSSGAGTVSFINSLNTVGADLSLNATNLIKLPSISNYSDSFVATDSGGAITVTAAKILLDGELATTPADYSTTASPINLTADSFALRVTGDVRAAGDSGANVTMSAVKAVILKANIETFENNGANTAGNIDLTSGTIIKVFGAIDASGNTPGNLTLSAGDKVILESLDFSKLGDVSISATNSISVLSAITGMTEVEGVSVQADIVALDNDIYYFQSENPTLNGTYIILDKSGGDTGHQLIPVD